jgi:hypothetical protein
MVATIDSVTAVMVNKRYFPIKGITIDVGGIISASNKKKTVKDRSNCNGYNTVRENPARENGMSHEFLLDDEKMGEGSGESSMDVDLSIFQEQLKMTKNKHFTQDDIVCVDGDRK